MKQKSRKTLKAWVSNWRSLFVSWSTISTLRSHRNVLVSLAVFYAIPLIARLIDPSLQLMLLYISAAATVVGSLIYSTFCPQIIRGASRPTDYDGDFVGDLSQTIRISRDADLLIYLDDIASCFTNPATIKAIPGAGKEARSLLANRVLACTIQPGMDVVAFHRIRELANRSLWGARAICTASFLGAFTLLIFTWILNAIRVFS